MRLLRAPALHMVLLGLVLFAADSLLGASATREELVVPRHRLERSLQALAKDLRRPPSAAEKQAVVDTFKSRTDSRNLHNPEFLP